MNDKYKILVSNTVIFAIGNLLVKLISFFLMPLYTSVLTTEQYGVAELLNSSIEIVLPIGTLSIVDALYRFSIDKDTDHKSLFINSMYVVIIGDAIVAAGCFALYHLFHYHYSLEFALLYCTTAFYRLTIQFARGMGHSKRYAMYGVMNALLLVGSNYTLLVVFNGGVKEYLLSFAISHGITGIIAFFVSKEYKFIQLSGFDLNQLKKMLKYSLPGIPNMLSWWVNSVSDRYIILLFCGSGIAGLYTAASKLPAMVNIVTSIFQQAWQYSTAKEIKDKNSNSFFSNVFNAYSFMCLLICTVLIMLNKFICSVLLQSEFFIAWRYVPILLLASTLGCYSAYFGTFYNAMKDNRMLMISTVVGAFINIFLNFMLIPSLEGIGAAIATMVSYAVVVLIRVLDIRKTLSISIDYTKWGIQVAILTIFAIVSSLLNTTCSYIFGMICLVIIVLFNKKVFEIGLRSAKAKTIEKKWRRK